VIVALDAMGGDRAPEIEIEGAKLAAAEGVEVLLVGDERVEGHGLPVLRASEVVTMDDPAAQAFRAKRDSSMRVAFDAVKDGRAAAVVSAGNSGAMLAHALFVLGRLPGVDRPAICTELGALTLCDAGANVDIKPQTLAQFARLGAAYDRVAHGRAEPRIGLVSNGAEPGKGTELTRAAHALLDGTAGYVGYVEGSDLFDGTVDVAVCDGFTGNVILKTAEGLAKALTGAEKYAETGGALLAGVDGVVVLAHGRSDATAIKNALLRASRFADAQIHSRLGA
jgi:glycerol-3-phosphate acyltransferase PlsX